MTKVSALDYKFINTCKSNICIVHSLFNVPYVICMLLNNIFLFTETYRVKIKVAVQ